MNDKKIKAVCFDFGGVIELFEGNLLGEIAKFLDVPLIEFRKEYFKHNHLSNVENMKWEDMIMKVVSFFDSNPKNKEKILSIVKKNYSAKKINTELLNVFSFLRKNGLKVAIFSNSSFELREKLIKNGIANLVDEIVISGEIGFQKPQQEAFQILFEKLHIFPKELIFVDDTPKSLEKASEIGYIPVLFKNNEQLKSDLHDLGIHF